MYNSNKLSIPLTDMNEIEVLHINVLWFVTMEGGILIEKVVIARILVN